MGTQLEAGATAFDESTIHIVLTISTLLSDISVFHLLLGRGELIPLYVRSQNQSSIKSLTNELPCQYSRCNEVFLLQVVVAPDDCNDFSRLF
jgi:hypothetical protein